MAKTNGTGTSRFTTRYTQAQKDSILRACLIEGMTVAQAIEHAGNGQLGVPAFTIGIYAYDIVKKGRDTFEAQHETALTAAVAEELKGAELDALATIRAIRRTFKRDGTGNTTDLARATRDLAAIRKARKDTAVQTNARSKAPSAQPNPHDSPPPAAKDSTLNSLLGLAEKTTPGSARSGSVNHARS